MHVWFDRTKMKDTTLYLTEQRVNSSGEVQEKWILLEDMYEKKLWHQLTQELLVFVKHPYFDEGDRLIQMYENFLSEIEQKLNLLSLTEIALVISKHIKDPNEAAEFLTKTKEKVKANQEALILCTTNIAQVRLMQKDYPATKELLSEVEAILDNYDGVSSAHTSFYSVSSTYHKLMGNHAFYYRDALRYLGLVDIKDISVEEQRERAFSLGLAGLLGEGIYNFGELLQHPVLKSLKDSEHSWLVDLLYAFNSGNLKKYEELRPQWSSQPDLASSELNLRQKISLLCLMEMTFVRQAKNRNIQFKEIAEAAQLPLNEVELMVMKALSLELVKGSIDEVNQVVHMTWVQPRVLDLEQISAMQKRLEYWCSNVKNMEVLVETKSHEFLT